MNHVLCCLEHFINDADLVETDITEMCVTWRLHWNAYKVEVRPLEGSTSCRPILIQWVIGQAMHKVMMLKYPFLQQLRTLQLNHQICYSTAFCAPPAARLFVRCTSRKLATNGTKNQAHQSLTLLSPSARSTVEWIVHRLQTRSLDRNVGYLWNRNRNGTQCNIHGAYTFRKPYTRGV